MPDDPANDFLQLLRALVDAGVEFTIVGGTAAVLHGASTATYDLDVVMPFTQRNCEQLLRAVTPLHPRLSHTPDRRALTVSAEELVRFKNLYLSTDLGRLDVLGALPPIASAERALAESERMELADDLTVPVIPLRMLIDVKAAMGRPKDKQVELELRAILDAKR